MASALEGLPAPTASTAPCEQPIVFLVVDEAHFKQHGRHLRIAQYGEVGAVDAAVLLHAYGDDLVQYKPGHTLVFIRGVRIYVVFHAVRGRKLFGIGVAVQGDKQIGSRVVRDVGALVQRDEHVRIAGHDHILPQPDQLVAYGQCQPQVVVFFLSLIHI